MSDEAPRHELEPPTPVGRSLLWRLQRASYQAQGPLAWRPGGVPLQVTSNPFIARLYAAVIAGLVRDLRVAGALTRPLTIVELGAGSGRFGFYLCEALAAAFARDGEQPWRLVMTDLAERNLAAWAAHPRLARFLADGRCDLARLDAEAPAPLALRVSGETLGPDDGGEPVVAIANYFFDSIAVDAWRIDGERARGCRLALAGPMAREVALVDPAAAIDALEWRVSVDVAGDQAQAGAAIAGLARDAVDGSTVLWPTAGLATIDFLARVGGGRLVVLTCDKGHREPALRPRRDDLGLVRHGGCVSLPVDYHALARAVEVRGGFALPATQRHDHLWAGVLALGLDARALPRCLDAVDELERFGPGDYQRLVDHTAASAAAPSVDPPHRGAMLRGPAGPDLSIEHLLTLLRLGAFDPRLVARFADALAGAVAAHKDDWLAPDLADALARAGALCFALPGQRDGVSAAIGTLLLHLGAPARAAPCLEASLDGSAADAPTLVKLAVCQVQLGRIVDARAAAARALALAPAMAEARQLAALLARASTDEDDGTG